MTFTMPYRLLVNTCGFLLGYRLAVNWDYTFLILLGYIGPTYIIRCLMFTGLMCTRICLGFHNIFIPYIEASLLPRPTVTLASEDL